MQAAHGYVGLRGGAAIVRIAAEKSLKSKIGAKSCIDARAGIDGSLAFIHHRKHDKP